MDVKQVSLPRITPMVTWLHLITPVILITIFYSAAVSRTTALMNIKIILEVAYKSAFRPSFCLTGSFARVFSHRQTDNTHTGPITPVLRKCGVIKPTPLRSVTPQLATAIYVLHMHSTLQ